MRLDRRCTACLLLVSLARAPRAKPLPHEVPKSQNPQPSSNPFDALEVVTAFGCRFTAEAFHSFGTARAVMCSPPSRRPSRLPIPRVGAARVVFAASPCPCRYPRDANVAHQSAHATRGQAGTSRAPRSAEAVRGPRCWRPPSRPAREQSCVLRVSVVQTLFSYGCISSQSSHVPMWTDAARRGAADARGHPTERSGPAIGRRPLAPAWLRGGAGGRPRAQRWPALVRAAHACRRGAKRANTPPQCAGRRRGQQQQGLDRVWESTRRAARGADCTAWRKRVRRVARASSAPSAPAALRRRGTYQSCHLHTHTVSAVQ